MPVQVICSAQHSDYSDENFGPVDARQAWDRVQSHPWKESVAKFNTLLADGADCCPPGVYLNRSDDAWMSVTAEDEGSFVLTFEVPKARRLLGIFAASKSVTKDLATLDQAQRYVSWFVTADLVELQRVAHQGDL